MSREEEERVRFCVASVRPLSVHPLSERQTSSGVEGEDLVNSVCVLVEGRDETEEGDVLERERGSVLTLSLI